MGLRGPKKGERPSGRKPGGMNKDRKTLVEMIEAACGVGYNPVVEMAEIGRTGLQKVFDPITAQQMLDPLTGLPVYKEVGDDIRQSSRKEAAQYLLPKRKAVEMSGPDGDPIDIRCHNDAKAVEALGVMLAELSGE